MMTRVSKATSPSRYLHLGDMGTDVKTFFSAHHDDKGQQRDITNEDVSKALKAAAVILDYPTAKGIPLDRIDTHLLQSGGANTLSLAGYPDTQIQKMGPWRVATFQRVHPKDLACFSEGMSKSMKINSTLSILPALHSTRLYG